MNQNEQLQLLGTLNGRFTEGRIRAMGVDAKFVRRAVAQGLFSSHSSGVLTSIPPRLREAKLRSMGLVELAATPAPPPAQDLQPGAAVQRVVDGVLKNFQVVRIEGGELVVIDPLNVPAGEVRVPRDDAAVPTAPVNEPGQPPTTDAHAPAPAIKPDASRMPYS